MILGPDRESSVSSVAFLASLLWLKSGSWLAHAPFRFRISLFTVSLFDSLVTHAVAAKEKYRKLTNYDTNDHHHILNHRF